MTICIEICIDEQGQILVGQDEDYDEQEEEQDHLEPVRSIGEALAKARELLEQAQQGGAQDEEEQGFQSGFAQQAPQSIRGYGPTGQEGQ